MSSALRHLRPESTREFWISLLTWLCGWLLASGFVVWHAVAVDRYLNRVTETRFEDGSVKTPLQRVPQAIAPDGQVWVRHSLAMAESEAWRLRSTNIDNAPEGRPIYWNSAWALWLSACGRVRMAFTGESLPVAIESASLWANLPVFLLVLTLASGWVWRRWGGMAGALMAVALAGHRKFYEGFYPGYCDHHGLISAAVLGVVVGMLFAGAGWWKREDDQEFSLLPKSEAGVMRAAMVSAVCGALGMWVSAASLVTTIALTGVAGLAAAVFFGSSWAGGWVCVPGAWRLWGRLGGALSLGFYLLENFPDRLGLRLEANHPLYCLAWWGAGEAIAAVLVWRREKRSTKWIAARLGGWGITVLVAPVVVGVAGAQVFAPLDPFLTRIHQSIHEFAPLWSAISSEGWKPFGDQLSISFLLLALLVIWWGRKPPLTERMVVVFITSVTLGATTLGWYQNRWLLTASGPQIGLALVLLLAVTARLRAGMRMLVVVTIGALLYVPGPWILARERLLVERRNDVQLGETVQLLYRDIAGALIKEGADARSIILADPNASVGIGYYGRMCTVGTLYWENRDGLHAAAEIFGARDDADAAARIHARGITHVAMISSYDFLPEYHYALLGGLKPADDRNGFGHRLLYQYRVPVWLRPLDYHVPGPLVPLGFKVALFAVDFDAPVSIAQERIGVYQLAKGERVLAEKSFMVALAADASRPEPWLLQGQLLLATGRQAEAFNFIRAGIERAPANDRERLLKTAADIFAQRGEEGQSHARALLDMLEAAHRAD